MRDEGKAAIIVAELSVAKLRAVPVALCRSHEYSALITRARINSIVS